MKLVRGEEDGDAHGDEAGREVFDDVVAALRRFCVLPSDHHYTALALWVMVSHIFPVFDIAPRLVVKSVVKRSGKTRVFEVISQLVRAPLSTTNITESALFHAVDEEPPPTVLLDEADTVFKTPAPPGKEGLRGVINGGFSRGAKVHRHNGTYSTHAMVALAGIGDMPDTIEDRALVIEMVRHDQEADPVQDYRVSRDAVDLVKLRRRLAAWAAGAAPQLRGVYPDVPVDDRAADTWYPLVAVADQLGDDVGRLARAACLSIVESSARDD